jgi:sodium-dependent dicarboxylate transporter 2/3/5
MAQAQRRDPLLLLVPVVMSCSLAFMLPTATAPNAIVYATGLLRIPRMVRTGAALNAAGVALVVGAMLAVGDAVYGVRVGEFPDWAQPN